MVGTYGVASVQWYWGRMAAPLDRLTYHLDEAFLYVFVFVDDYMLLLLEHECEHWSAVFVIFLIVADCPTSWTKNGLSSESLWVGYDVDINTGKAGLPPSKSAPIQAALGQLAAGQRF